MKKINYKHYICIAITITFLLISVIVFANSLGRIIESFRDFWYSIAYYFCKICKIPNNINVTVNDISKIPFFDFPLFKDNPIVLFPVTWESFKTKFVAFFQLFFSKKNFLSYLVSFVVIVRVISIIIVPLLLLIIIFRIFISNYLNNENNSYSKESLPLRLYKKISGKIFIPVRNWFKEFFSFLKENKWYLRIWLFIWAYNFNFITILVEFIAWFFYFALSFDFASLYRQVYKLVIDLSVVINFVPFFVFVIFGVICLYKISLSVGMAKLRHRERRNRGFIGDRDVFNLVYGPPGSGKTALITDLALTYEVKIIQDALEIIIERDMQFPNFPWAAFENALKWAIKKHSVYDVYSCRLFVAKKRCRFEKNPCKEKLFGYDYERYGLYYNDKLTMISIWDALDSYAQAYFIYGVQSSYIISNYSVRSDKLRFDLGNFPIWNTDFFARDSRLIDSFSRHSHILDFDMFRWGRQMLQNNLNRNALGFGVYVVTEIDKEYKNTLELQDIKRNSVECNQKNDLSVACFMMFRHICTIDNKCFTYFLGDLQRTGSLSSKFIELGEKSYISDKSEMSPALPFYSPYWFIDLLNKALFGKFKDFYLDYKYVRADNTLFLYLIKNICARLSGYCKGIENQFGSQTLKLLIERSVGDSKSKSAKWYRQSKKIYSGRFRTDCLASISEERSCLNVLSLDELREYESILASKEERLYQNSYFQRDVSLVNKDI